MTDRTASDNDALTFVGFGFGAIQAGLFVREALLGGAFARCVVVEIDRRVVEAVRSAGGHYGLNVAWKDHVERLTLGPVELLDPSIAADREAIVAAIATASEVATALPSVRFFRGDGAGSPHRLLAEGIRRRRELPAARLSFSAV